MHILFFICLVSISSTVYGSINPTVLHSNQLTFHTTETDTIRVLSYNIQHGRGLDNVVDLRRIADVIIDSRADIVALQEVDMGVERSYRFDTMKILSGYTGLESIFYKNIHHQGGEYGNGILSRFPFHSSRNYHFVIDGNGEQRGLLQAEIVVGNQKIVLMNTHLDHRPDETHRLISVEQIIQTMYAYRGLPAIIAGDFNDLPGSNMHMKMKECFHDVWELLGNGDGYTFRSDRPDRRIDYILFSNSLEKDNTRKLRPVSVEVLDSQASDHLPILAVFVLE
jgi:endonuclease/exonuclease/phosphatase family metal-dependent hydrolase